MLKTANKKILLITMCILVAAFLAGCGSGSSAGKKTGGPVYSNYSTYVFFGVDSRAAGDEWKTDNSTGTEGAPSSDVIMLLTVNQDSGEASVLSVYRDAMLDVAGDGSDFEKCNTAYRDGGAYGAIDMLEKNLDIHIDGYVTANFMNVADAIDLLGGVTVDIEDQKIYKNNETENAGDDVVDVINLSIDELNRIYSKNSPHVEHAGEQTLDGIQAVAYSRVRYTEGYDISRTARQRNIVTLMAQKMKSSDTNKQHEVLKEMYKKIDTDLTESELMDLFDMLVDLDLDSMDGYPFRLAMIKDEAKGVMFVPCDLIENNTELHKYLYGNSEYEASGTVEEYDKLIKDETGLTAENYDAELSAY